LGRKKKDKWVEMDEGFLLINCPECGGETAECPQTKKHDKKRKTEAVVYQCRDNHRCKTTVIVTTKIMNIRKAKRTRTTGPLAKLPQIKPKDLEY